MRKVVLLLVLIVGLAPGTWLRSPADRRQILHVGALQVDEVDLGPLDLAGAWLLDSPHDSFGSYSALAALDDQWLAFAPLPHGREGMPHVGVVKLNQLLQVGFVHGGKSVNAEGAIRSCSCSCS